MSRKYTLPMYAPLRKIREEEAREEEMNKVVNNPKHYNNGKIECIDAIESAVVNKKGIEAVCVGNIIKYVWRYEDKNGVEDLKKAKWYLERCIRYLESGV